MPFLNTLLSLILALILSSAVGLGLGRVATQWFGGRGLSNLLMDVRGSVLSFLVSLLLLEAYSLQHWLSLGLVVGISQAIAVCRWITRRSGEWTPALVGGIALGRSTAALVTRRAAARGAVAATLATTCLHLLTLEGAVYLFDPEGARQSVGALIAASAGGPWSIVAPGCALVLFTLEVWFSSMLQKNQKAAGRAD